MVFGAPVITKTFKDLQIAKITINNVDEQTEFIDKVFNLGVIVNITFCSEDSLSCVLLSRCGSG